VHEHPQLAAAMAWGEPARNILIIGATGVIGTYITRAIVDAQHHFDRICVLTSEKTVVEKVQDICALESWGVEVFVSSLNDEKQVKEAYKGEWHACTGTGKA
jgi:nucleoside-diphosphate-sugar epimerase